MKPIFTNKSLYIAVKREGTQKIIHKIIYFISIQFNNFKNPLKHLHAKS